MVRKEAYELAQKIKGTYGFGGSNQTSYKGKRICLVGRKGTGKTAVMNYLGQLGMEAAMIVLPTQGLEYPNDHLGFILRNEESGLFDQPRFAQDWFKYMLAVNPHSLARVGLKGDYSDTDWHWDPEIEYDERTERKKDVGVVYRTLADLADLGSRNPEFAAELMYKFVEEIYALESTEPGVLVLVDDINWWEGQSDYYDPATVQKLKATKMAMVEHIGKFVKNPPANSTVVYSLATSGYMRYSPGYIEHADEVVEIPKYTHNEFLSALMHYQICNLPELERPDFNLRWINYTKALSGMVPHEVLKVMTIL